MRLLQGWRKLPAWTRRSLVAAAIFVASVVVLTNVALWTRLIPKLVNAESATLSYDSAWAPWPTFVRVRGLSIAGQDANIRYAIGLDEAWLNFDLLPALRHRTITLKKVRGAGASVRILQRLDPWEVDPVKVKALPQVDGFPMPPITDASVPRAPSQREGYKKVSIEIRDVDAVVRELWIDEFRYVGNLHVMGEFLLRPGLELRIGPRAEAVFRDGNLTIAAQPLLVDIRGTAQCDAPSFNAAKPPGLTILRYFSGGLKIFARLPNAEALNYFVRESDLQIRGGAGGLDLSVGIKHGILNPESTLALAADQLRVRFAKSQILSSVQISASTAADGLATLGARTNGLEIANARGDQKLSGGQLIAQTRSEAIIDLSETLPTMSYSAQLSRLSGPLTVVQGYLPPNAPLAIDDGNLGIQGEVSGTSGHADLKAQLRVDSQFSAHDPQRRFAGKIVGFGKLSETTELLDFSGSRVEISDLMMAQDKDVVYGWWTHVDANSGGYVPGKSPRIWFLLDGLLRDIEPLFVGWGQELGVPDWARALLPLPRTSWKARLDVEAGAFRVSDLRARSGAVKARLKLKKPAESEPVGAVLVTSGPLSFGASFGSSQSGTQLLASDDWFEKQP